MTFKECEAGYDEVILGFERISDITTYFSRSEKLFGQTFTMSTIRIGEEFTFQSPNSEDIQELVDFFLDGLKRRSNYVIALQDYAPPSQFFLVFASKLRTFSI